MDIPPELDKIIPGFAGSATAMLFLKQRLLRAIGMIAAGTAMALLLGSYVAVIMGSDVNVARYITGLFGMSIVTQVFDMIFNFDSKRALNDLWKAVVKRIKGE